ncbi:hypothetical protein F5Y18DRAFT_375337 [Xylariaceae sp. FL1019]|nr:hypothetical protein F5Y18DRAFT_375337 [Xylariaceae sp. FL1019]
MAGTNGVKVKQEPGISPNKGETPEEEQIKQALKHLDHLHVKCRGLRTTLPRMIERIMPEALPSDIKSSKKSQEQVVAMVKAQVQAAGNEIKDFRTLYTNEESKKVLEQAQKSREANPKGIKPWRYKDHPDWWDPDG